MNDEVKLFSPKPTISLRSARKLSGYIVRVKPYLIERNIELFKYIKKLCEVCENVNLTNSFTSLVIQNTYKINHKLNFGDKCLI